MTEQLATESLFLMEKIHKQVASLESSEVYVSIDIKYVSVITKGGSRKNELRNAMYCRNSVHLWGYG